MAVHADATMQGLDLMVARLISATRDIVSTAADIVQEMSRATTPIGTPGNSTNPPGDLAASIFIDAVVIEGVGVYSTKVGPTTVYGRQRELGGPIVPVEATALHFFRFGKEVFAWGVFQEPNPYMARGEDAALPLIAAMVNQKVSAALRG